MKLVDTVPSSMLPFSLDRTRHDQNTYFGRVRHYLGVVDPTAMFATQRTITQAMQLLQDYKENKLGPSVTHDQLWRARELRDAVVRPGSDESIFPLFRMSAFVPMNLPICYGLLRATGLGSQLLWQIINQSYNVGVNYSNRSATSTMTTDQVFDAYCWAVAMSCGVAGGMWKLGKMINVQALSPFHGALARGFIPFAGVFSASTLNLYLVRKNEIENGIDVRDKNGNVLGISRAASEEAFFQTASARTAFRFGSCVFPPLLEYQLMKIDSFKSFMTANPSLKIPVQLSLIAACLWGSLPLAFALFPHTASMDVSELESEFHGLIDGDGNPITTVYFNKGL